MKVIFILALFSLVACKGKVQQQRFYVEYFNGDKDTINQKIVGNVDDCYLKNGCLRGFVPSPYALLFYSEDKTIACNVRRYNVLK